MENQFDVGIVSAFGRGNWLASEIQGLGLKVGLIDVSERLGRWTPEDWEGPFGFFHSDKLRRSQLTRLLEEDYYDSVDEGFTVWLKDGPFDLKGPLTAYHSERLGFKGPVESYILNYDQMNTEQLSEARYEIADRSFDSTWLAHLAHQMASNAFLPNALGMSYGRPLPLYSPYFARRVSRRGFEKSMEWLNEKGVRVFSKADLEDFWIEGRRAQSLEIKADWSGAFRAKTFIWCLTSEETSRFPEKVGQGLFPKGAMKPLWSWVRARIQLRKGPFIDTLPVKFVVIEEMGLPWTHHNLLLMQRTVTDTDLDAWVRIPNQQRFQRAYLEMVLDNVLRILSSRLPHSEPKILDMPQDYHYEYEELGPPRFPVYRQEDLKSFQRQTLRNLFYDGPESWELLDWTGQFRNQMRIFDEIKDWKQRQDRGRGERK